MSSGLYISVPFCRTKCSYCNFASGVFSRAVFARYVDRLCADIELAEAAAARIGAKFERAADSVYLGGGTPSVLEPAELERLFRALRANFALDHLSEITMECAPGTLTPQLLDSLLRCGVNRVSLGVQSFVDGEAAAVGRLHTRAVVLDDIARLRSAGISNLNLDLIAGLPHQTAESWRVSLDEAVVSAVPHVSIYMLEVDQDSRLGRELIAGGTRYHAHFVPDEDAMADFYLEACERLEEAGIRQYEISNFARQGCESRHNLKYWTRQPYLGLGVDAHSMLLSSRRDPPAWRIASPDSLEAYLAGAPAETTAITRSAALEEAFFLGLRLLRGIDLRQLGEEFGLDCEALFAGVIAELRDLQLVELADDRLRLTSRGRLLSNEVFQKFLLSPMPTDRAQDRPAGYRGVKLAKSSQSGIFERTRLQPRR